jgi:hypothetical protein
LAPNGPTRTPQSPRAHSHTQSANGGSTQWCAALCASMRSLCSRKRLSFLAARSGRCDSLLVLMTILPGRRAAGQTREEWHLRALDRRVKARGGHLQRVAPRLRHVLAGLAPLTPEPEPDRELVRSSASSRVAPGFASTTTDGKRARRRGDRSSPTAATFSPVRAPAWRSSRTPESPDR